MKTEFLNVIHERGYIKQSTDLAQLDNVMSEKSIAAYVGFDATADSLHVGSLVSIMMLRQLQKHGHRPIVLMGGGTTKIGDPSDKNSTRKMLTDAEIEHNISGIKKVFEKFLYFDDGPNPAIMIDNSLWLDNLNYLKFLRDVGKHFTINRMLTFDFVKKRLEENNPLTFLEFNYMIMQGYDFVELNKMYDCVLQLGGSDQWGNIVNGIELGRRMNNVELFGMTTPLIASSSGNKMGKTADGAVWLNSDKTSAYEYWQFWRNTEDADVGRFLRLFTELPIEDIEQLEKLQGGDINRAKKVLAFEATELLHGHDAADESERIAASYFENTDSLANRMNSPGLGVSRNITLVDAIIAAKFTDSRSEAKRMIDQGGVKVHNIVVKDPNIPIRFDCDSAFLSYGKKKHVLLVAKE